MGVGRRQRVVIYFFCSETTSESQTFVGKGATWRFLGGRVWEQPSRRGFRTEESAVLRKRSLAGTRFE
jgi:hypothetical protein